MSSKLSKHCALSRQHTGPPAESKCGSGGARSTPARQHVARHAPAAPRIKISRGLGARRWRGAPRTRRCSPRPPRPPSPPSPPLASSRLVSSPRLDLLVAWPRPEEVAMRARSMALASFMNSLVLACRRGGFWSPLHGRSITSRHSSTSLAHMIAGGGAADPPGRRRATQPAVAPPGHEPSACGRWAPPRARVDLLALGLGERDHLEHVHARRRGRAATSLFGRRESCCADSPALALLLSPSDDGGSMSGGGHRSSIERRHPQQRCRRRG